MVQIEDLQKKIQAKRNESFSNTAKKLKEKAKEIQESERNEVLNTIKELSTNVAKMSNDNASSMQTLVRYLQYQEEKLREGRDRASEISLDIAKSINDLIQVEENSPKISKQDIAKIIKNTLGEFANILVKDQISNYGKLTKDAQGRVTRIEERFNKTTLVTTFYYSPDGSFEWSTETVE